MKKIKLPAMILIFSIAISAILCSCNGDPCANGHSWGGWTTSIEATCTQKGEDINTCNVCGDTITRDVDMLDHDYVNGKCKRCGFVEASYIPSKELFRGNVFQIEI